MEGLYPLTLIGNPLQIPFLKTGKRYDEMLYNPDPGDHYKMVPFSTTGSLWVAYEPISLKNGCGIYMAEPDLCLKTGILQEMEVSDGIFGQQVERFDTCIQKLVNAGIVMDTTYRKAFERLGIEDYFDEALCELPKQVYQVHEDAYQQVDIVQVSTKRPGSGYRKILDILREPAWQV